MKITLSLNVDGIPHEAVLTLQPLKGQERRPSVQPTQQDAIAKSVRDAQGRPVDFATIAKEAGITSQQAKRNMGHAKKKYPEIQRLPKFGAWWKAATE